ncbi:mechanosensitive ion channel family protein [Thalassorhabdomicrobium marinisediminis]|uniref:DUF3772 domain-containing protein n=1 Tax=Thalassorhabdomicrobium marinisediminis TaxID=2170577 RepID=A0A2T7G1A2_9RHOB|nr:DUF3772 domain-containing protein [Thalassorhabdomicrobium marinisediminis]PVA08216.1 DUF3772 domain-containing protein [Thalassorhabdomicrobium marinisediminis]
MKHFLCMIALLASVAGGPAFAQSTGILSDVTGGEAPAEAESAPADTGALALSEEEEAAAEALPKVFEDQDEWRTLADRVGVAVEEARASTAVLGDLRSQLAAWRDTFLERQSINSARIETIRAQINALGEPPAEGVEDPRITERRVELSQKLQLLEAPAVLATEAYTQANGLIGEVDDLISSRESDRLSERVQTPLNPESWPRAGAAAVAATRAMTSEVRANLANPSKLNSFYSVLPAILVLATIGLILLFRGRGWYNRATRALVDRSKRSRDVLRFVLSLGQILIPFIGVLALAEALTLSGFLGRRLFQVVEALPILALFPIVAHWIAGHLTPLGLDQDRHPLLMTPEVSTQAHRQFIFLGYMLMIFGVMERLIAVNGIDPVPAAVLTFPFGLVIAWALYWFADALKPELDDASDDASRSFRVTLRTLLSRGLKIVAVVGVVAGAVGYINAFEAVTAPAALTVYVVAVMLLLQRLSVDFYAMVSKSENGAQDALIPVLIGFLLILISLPILALIWGAQWTDLTELWARFREGFSIGETKISPSSFLLFALVFVVGYTVTRLTQAALRTTVLPRTKLDVGGQDALVSGLGYVGIFLAAVIAITTAGIDLSGLAIVAGALSVGIGFGLQNIVSNFVSGIILLIERPISQGDWIEVGDQMGYVRDISVRSTRIETFDRTDVIVPNGDLVSNQVINWTRGNNVGRVIVPVGVAYGTDTEWVAGILKEIAEAHPMVLMNPAPSVVFQGFGADSLDFEIRAILRDVNYVLSVKSEMNHEIAKRFAQEEIEIPFSQRDIWLRNPEVLDFGKEGDADETDNDAGKGASATHAEDHPKQERFREIEDTAEAAEEAQDGDGDGDGR